MAKAKRKLAAILNADVVGYSRLMSERAIAHHARRHQDRMTLERALVAGNGLEAQVELPERECLAAGRCHLIGVAAVAYRHDLLVWTERL